MIYAKDMLCNLVKSPYLKKVLDATKNFDISYIPSSYNMARFTYLQEEVISINKVDLDKCTKEWSRIGFTLLSDS